MASGLIYDATLSSLELIGEAATRISDEVRAAYHEIPRRMIIATRNRLIYGYLGIDEDRSGASSGTMCPNCCRYCRR